MVVVFVALAIAAVTVMSSGTNANVLDIHNDPSVLFCFSPNETSSVEAHFFTLDEEPLVEISSGFDAQKRIRICREDEEWNDLAWMWLGNTNRF
jgi:hypothetical protein